MKKSIALSVAFFSVVSFLSLPSRALETFPAPICAMQLADKPLSGSVQDVTARFAIADNAVVSQLTNVTGTGKSGAMLTYYDVTGYLPDSDRLIFNVHTKTNGPAYNYMVSTNTDGTDALIHARWISPTTPTSYGFVSDDGQLLIYMGETEKPGSFDIYGVWLDSRKAGGPSCTAYRISKQYYSCTQSVDTASKCVERPTLSPPVYDPGLKKYIINYNVGTKLYSLAYDETKPGELAKGAYGAKAATGLVRLDDPSSADFNLGFHRVRTNPKYPNLVMYRRSKPGSFDSRPGFEVVDLKNPTVHLKMAEELNGGFHPVWHPNGLKVGVNKGLKSGTPLNRRFTEFTVAKEEVSAGFKVKLLKGKVIPYPNAPDHVFYASYSRDAAKPYIAFATGLEDISSEKNLKGKLYVMERNPSAVPVALGFTNFYSEEEIGVDGQPRLSFYDGAAGILFSSDNGIKGAPPQVYTITGYALPK